MPRGFAAAHRVWRAEDGAVTVFGLLTLMIIALLVGFAIDVANLYRQQNLLQLTADAAAHAGAAALARGEGPDKAEAAATAMVERNLPAARFGRLVASPRADLQALALDPATGHLARADAETPANAMLVTVQRSAAVDNPIPTFVLRLAGVDSWSAKASSVVAVQPTRRCDNAAGIYAHGHIAVSSGSSLGAGLCLHSQSGITRPTGAGPTEARLSLPSLDGCEVDCAAAIEMNLLMPVTLDHVARLAAGFAAPGLALPEKAAFFATRPLDADLEPLAEVGVATDKLVTGSVVPMSAFRFSAMRGAPAGLVYLVTCDLPADRVPQGSIDRIDIMGTPDRPRLKDMVLITTCPLDLDAATRVEGALVILLHGDTTVLNAVPGASFGDPAGSCAADRRTVLMTTGDLRLPAGIATSNLAAVAGGNVVLESGPDGTPAVHHGLAIHAGGQVAMEGPQTFTACPGAADPVLPELRVIAHAQPSLEGWVAPLFPARPEVEMPGERVKERVLEGTRATQS